MKRYNIMLLRAIACLLVIVYHMNNMIFGIDGKIRQLFSIGGVAPYIFFVISGFFFGIMNLVQI